MSKLICLIWLLVLSSFASLATSARVAGVPICTVPFPQPVGTLRFDYDCGIKTHIGYDSQCVASIVLKSEPRIATCGFDGTEMQPTGETRFKIAGPTAFSAIISKFLAAEETTAGSQMTTVLGSGRDVAPYVGKPGFNTFTGAGIPAAELDTQNALWLNNAIQRGDQIWLVTDPAAHQALMNQLNLQSAYLNLELPMLGEYSGVNAIPKFAPPPVVGIH